MEGGDSFGRSRERFFEEYMIACLSLRAPAGAWQSNQTRLPRRTILLAMTLSNKKVL